MEQVRGVVELTRPGNALAAGVLTFIGAFVAGGLAAPASTAVAVLATGAATGGGNAINDYFDREIDAINRPDRPIPRGAVTPRGAFVFSLALFAAAVGLTLLLPPIAVAIAVVNLLALLAYTEMFKGLPGVGNALVAYLTGSTFLYGGAAVGGDLATVSVLFVLAAAATMAREIVKDVEDVAGDRKEGLSTLPIAVGERTALGVAAVFVATAMLASPLPFLRGTFGSAYLVVLVPTLLGLGAGTYRSFDDPATGQTWLKASMFLAALAFVAGRAAVVV
ncbi:(S)-2,3-di-O-geranylgeranylglyceryl phosphate synthase [Natronomonas moolapensis 8.8.11]|uniref:Digeranylgeranylglyceryl phosphate synthase n=1 Tax=Natronomonas moolapensis (strain DSM 18674 / CECT 7526 / JCM 14361 / 8.8.11) TaxID=268739 RepID=M1XS14_NATM8|nr:geranylgeranylglycerol-phosphate geranylgeranyltransferase [Natronomonas moolapensis]CCQ37103.1 (S)-2,3-di-O-geranylgeranylglyceryl phosphate synthase [Natronomonas moolapensis 8.8.11]